MKIKITYQTGEEKKAWFFAHIARKYLPFAKLKETDAHPPYRHIYISSKPPEVPPQ